LDELDQSFDQSDKSKLEKSAIFIKGCQKPWAKPGWLFVYWESEACSGQVIDHLQE